MNKPTLAVLIVIVIAIIVVAGFLMFPRETVAPTPPLGNGSFLYGEAVVTDMDVLILESFPVQVRVIVRGELPDGCTTVDSVTFEREETVFTGKVTTKRPKDAFCTQVITPFEESVSLDVVGLAKGTYTARVGSLSREFVLEVDNVAR